MIMIILRYVACMIQNYICLHLFLYSYIIMIIAGRVQISLRDQQAAGNVTSVHEIALLKLHISTPPTNQAQPHDQA